MRTGVVSLNETYGDKSTPIQCLRWGKWLKFGNHESENLHNGIRRWVAGGRWKVGGGHRVDTSVRSTLECGGSTPLLDPTGTMTNLTARRGRKQRRRRAAALQGASHSTPTIYYLPPTLIYGLDSLAGIKSTCTDRWPRIHGEALNRFRSDYPPFGLRRAKLCGRDFAMDSRPTTRRASLCAIRGRGRRLGKRRRRAAALQGASHRTPTIYYLPPTLIYGLDSLAGIKSTCTELVEPSVTWTDSPRFS